MILFLSNGSGEDSIACLILNHLRQPMRERQEELAVFPLVGEGAAYQKAIMQGWALKMVGSSKPPPSQGLSNENWRLWLTDLRHGLLVQKAVQLHQLRKLRRQVRVVVCVGDLLTVLLARLAGYRRTIFVGTAKSSYHHPYSKLERWILARCSRQILARDELTAAELRSHGLPAQWLGNAMMDQLPINSGNYTEGTIEIAVFPGSRSQTYQQLPTLLGYLREAASQLDPQNLLIAKVAVADSIEVAQLVRCCSGWLEETSKPTITLTWPGLANLQVQILVGDLVGALSHSQLALGVAGTAHEQAAGCGLPVIAPHPQGQPLGWYRGRQKGLLGEALLVCPPNQVAANILHLLRNPSERQRRANIGQERMGPSGGAQRMAQWILANS